MDEARPGFDQRRAGDEVGRVATMLTTAASQRVRGQRLRTERGANRGRVGVEDCACDRSNSEQGMGAERRARGLPRERAGCTEQQQLAAVVMLAASGVGAAGGGVSVTTLSPQRLQGVWCRKMAVSWR